LISSLSWGGAETLLADFAQGAADVGIEVSVAYLRADAQVAGRLSAIGIEPVAIPITSLLDRHDWRRVRDHIAAVGPDLVHTHLGNADLLGGLSARRLGIPSVSTVHLVVDRGVGVRGRAKARLFGLGRRHGARAVITVSEAARRVYLETGWDRPDRVVAVHNGIVDRSVPGAGPRIRSELGIGPRDPVLAMIAVLRRDKNHAVAVEATRRLLGRFPDLRLLILGDGLDRDHVAQAAAPLGERAIMTGHRDDVMEVLDAVDVLVHPTLRDAFPTTLLEAAAARVPAGATAVEGIPEIIEPDRTGLLIDAPPTADELAGAIGRLLGDPGLRERMAQEARRSFEQRFTVERWLERLLPIYERVLERPRRRAPRAASRTHERQ
jgi:glycosyltransferase involved in cell wall biosynthesis